MAKGEIEFDHVWFKYKDTAKEYVLSDVSFHIKPGQTVGIIGQTGSSKTTLVQLIPRLYDVTKGEVKIDGINVKSIRSDIFGTQLRWYCRKIRCFPVH